MAFAMRASYLAIDIILRTGDSAAIVKRVRLALTRLLGLEWARPAAALLRAEEVIRSEVGTAVAAWALR